MAKSNQRTWSGVHLTVLLCGNHGDRQPPQRGKSFFNKLGAARLECTICGAAGDLGYSLVYVKSMRINPIESAHAKLIIFWGINALASNIHQAILADHAIKKGGRIVVIDVHRDETARWADCFIQFCLALILRLHWE